jgi:general secretion pathway protein G
VVRERKMGVDEKRGSGAARGFTLIELLVVVAIIGLLATVAVGQYRGAIIKAKEAVLREDLYVMRTAINQYFADKGQYPADLRTLVEESYIRDIPADPITGSADTWVEIFPEYTDGDISTEPGISDVQSGADGFSPIDGSSYSEW